MPEMCDTEAIAVDALENLLQSLSSNHTKMQQGFKQKIGKLKRDIAFRSNKAKESEKASKEKVYSLEKQVYKSEEKCKELEVELLSLEEILE